MTSRLLDVTHLIFGNRAFTVRSLGGTAKAEFPRSNGPWLTPQNAKLLRER